MVELIACPACQAQVSSEAAACPKCGHPLAKRAAPPPAPVWPPTYREAGVPPYRRNGFLLLMALVCLPVALVIVLTGPVYYIRAGRVAPYSVGQRVAAIVLGCVVLSTALYLPIALSGY